MIKLAFLIAALSLGVLVEQCDLSLGDLDEFVINYRVEVTNTGDVPAAIHVDVQDKTRDATLQPRQTLELVSFKGGVWHVRATSAVGRKTILQDRYKKFSRELDAMTNRSARAFEDLDDDLDDLEEAIAKAADTGSGGGCAGTMSDPGGDTLSISLSNVHSTATDDTWDCSGQ